MTQAINTRNPDGPTWPHDQLIHAWWVIPGRLLAGEYPGSLDPNAAARKRQALVDAGVDSILGHIQRELDSNKIVYVHCWGGKGRTGTVIGAWLIEREDLTYAEALQRMQELRRGTRKSQHPVPESEVRQEVLRKRAELKKGRR